MTRKTVTKSRERDPKAGISSRCYVSFGQNESLFFRNSHNAMLLLFRWVPTIYISLSNNELRAILVGGVVSICRKLLPGQQIGKVGFSAQSRLCITNYNNPL